jgi:carboxypeptidase C (cathepsin A)
VSDIKGESGGEGSWQVRYFFLLNKQYQVIFYFGDTASSIRNSEANSSVYLQLKWNMEARFHSARFETWLVVLIMIQVFWI